MLNTHQATSPISMATRFAVIVLLVLSMPGCGKHAVDTPVVEGRNSSNETPNPAGRPSDENAPAPKADASSPQYWLLISQNITGDEFEDDETVAIGGGSIGGMLKVYVNESPIQFYNGGGHLIRLTEWLKNGENQVKIEGRHKDRIYAKVLSTPTQTISGPVGFSKIRIKEVLAKGWLEPEKEDFSLTFEAHPAWSAAMQSLPDAGVARGGWRRI